MSSSSQRHPISRGTEAPSNYLLRLLVAIVSSKGEVRIPIQSLIESDIGSGVVKHYDAVSKELVLRFLPSEAAEVYLIAEPAPSAMKIEMPASASSSASSASAEVSRALHTILTDEILAAREQTIESQRKLRDIDNYRSPAPRERIPIPREALK